MSLEERLMRGRDSVDTEPLNFEDIKQGSDGVHSNLSEEKSDHKKRADGRKPLLLEKKWGLVRCGGPNRQVKPFCSELLIVKHGQKTKKCIKCGKRRNIGSKKVLAYSDSKDKIRDARNQLKKEKHYRAMGDLDE